MCSGSNTHTARACRLFWRTSLRLVLYAVSSLYGGALHTVEFSTPLRRNPSEVCIFCHIVMRWPLWVRCVLSLDWRIAAGPLCAELCASTSDRAVAHVPLCACACALECVMLMRCSMAV